MEGLVHLLRCPNVRQVRTMNLSSRGLSLIKEFEGLSLTAYKCPAGIWTIGYGSTGDRVYPGMQIDKSYAERMLLEDLLRFEKGVESLVRVPLSQGAYDALVSFSFNLGVGALSRSTLLKKLNSGDYSGAADEFLRWNKAGGRVLKGLVRRRKAERNLFLTEGEHAS